MTLLKLKNGKYIIVQDSYDARNLHDQAVELTLGKEVITEGTLDDIINAKWYGWRTNTPNQIREYAEADGLRVSSKLKQIQRFCKVIQGAQSDGK